MKKNFKTLTTIIAAATSIITPAAGNNNVENNRSIQIEQSNKNAVLQKVTKKQGININNTSGGLDFNMVRMMQAANPIYIPYYHNIMSYRAQNRAAKLRKNKKN